MENQSKFKTSKEIINYLAATFPHCFSTKGEAKPLKIGIFYDLVERLGGSNNHISKVKLRAALRTYTQSWRYLQSIKEGARRVDLDGLPSDSLTPEHIIHAQTLLKEGKERVKANKIAQNKENNTLKKEKPRSVVTKKRSGTSALLAEKKHAVQHDKIEAKGRVKQVLHAADVTSLKVGDEVKINLSSKPVKAVLIAIEKENVRVKIQSGMELTVKSEYIVE